MAIHQGSKAAEVAPLPNPDESNTNGRKQSLPQSDAVSVTKTGPASASAAEQRHTTIIDGVAYDITDFMRTHPGGADLLLLAVGRDASVLFHSYHRRLNVAQQVLVKLPRIDIDKIPLPSPVFGRRSLTPGSAVSSARSTPPPITSSTPLHLLNSPLYNEIRREVNEYFARHSSSSGGPLRSRGGMVLKSLLLLFLTAFTYFLVVFRGVWLLAPLLGILFAINGFAIQHDANHGAFSCSRLVNTLAGFVDDLIGGSGLMWRHQHMLAHHAYPNDSEWDVDSFGNYPILKLNPALPAKWWHRYQHIYIIFLYSLIALDYSVMDIVNYLRGRYAHIDLHPLRLQDHLLFIIGKVAHFSLVLLIPVWVEGWAWWRVIGGVYLPLELCGGLFLASLFAVSHNTEQAAYNLPKDAADSHGGVKAGASSSTGDVPCWAEMQIRTSCNWSCSSTFWLWVSGGLNYQIEHHLFPAVAHIHYPAIHRIVKRICQQRSIPYNEYASFTEIFLAHLRMVKKLGQTTSQSENETKKEQ